MRHARPESLRQAVLLAVAYADIFDSALPRADLPRYLIGWRATPEDIALTLDSELCPSGTVYCKDGWLHLPGRAALVDQQRASAPLVTQLRRQAADWGRRIAGLPFVRMVALTGALASGSATHANDDFDYLVVTRPGYLWLARALILGLSRLSGGRLCPNYLITADALILPDQGLYPAQEMARMIPLAGHDVYDRLRAANPWALAYLPNAAGPPGGTPDTSGGHHAQHLAEGLLDSRLGRGLERWEMRRKIRKLSGQSAPSAETVFGPNVCKGHFSGHSARVAAIWEDRLRALGLADGAHR